MEGGHSPSNHHRWARTWLVTRGLRESVLAYSEIYSHRKEKIDKFWVGYHGGQQIWEKYITDVRILVSFYAVAHSSLSLPGNQKYIPLLQYGPSAFKCPLEAAHHVHTGPQRNQRRLENSSRHCHSQEMFQYAATCPNMLGLFSVMATAYECCSQANA